MSKVDLTQTENVKLDTTGGSFSYECDITEGDYTYGDFRLYDIAITIGNVAFAEECIEIRKIGLEWEGEERITLVPDRCRIKKVDGISPSGILRFNHCPFTLPGDMYRFPLTLSSDESVEVVNIFSSNDEFRMNLFLLEDGRMLEEFEPFFVNPDVPVDWKAQFEIDNGGENRFKTFATTIVVEYVRNGKHYYAASVAPRTIYNSFTDDTDLIEEYLNQGE